MTSKVAIVMPSYNCEKYVALTLRTLLDQSYEDYKIFAVNDGSTDRTLDVILDFQKKHPDKIVITSQENGGTGDALNCGFDLVSKNGDYDYGTMVSSDNIYYPNYISTLVSALDNSKPETVMTYGNFHYINANNQIINALIHQIKPDDDLVRGYDVGPAFLFKMHAKHRAGKYWRRICEDYHMAVKLRQFGTFELIPLILMGFRVRDGQLTGSDDTEETRASEYCSRLATTILTGNDAKAEEVYSGSVNPMVHRYDWQAMGKI